MVLEADGSFSVFLSGGVPREALKVLRGARCGKIGMITRRTTQVVAWTTMPRSATQLRPKALPEGPATWGSGSGGDADREGRLHTASGSHLPAEDTAPSCAVATIRVVVFRASHPAKTRRAPVGLVQGFPRP
ncbi:MAG: hypothetical protein H0X43_01760 [Nitrosospira sp.]|nr:hypothetical protein [Nitrosospira sp.]